MRKIEFAPRMKKRVTLVLRESLHLELKKSWVMLMIVGFVLNSTLMEFRLSKALSSILDKRKLIL